MRSAKKMRPDKSEPGGRSHVRLPARLRPEHVVAIVDTREQHPLDLSPLQSAKGTLVTGDYSIDGLTNHVAIERKSLPDLIACVGRERERFGREIQRLLAYPVRALVVEGSWQQLESADWRGKVKAPAATSSVIGWMAKGIPVVMAGDHHRAGRVVSRILYIAARRRYEEGRTLLGSTLASTATSKLQELTRAD